MKQYLEAREALEVSLKNIGRSDIKKEKDRDNYRMRVSSPKNNYGALEKIL